MGTIHGFCAKIQASAICAGVASLRCAISFRRSTKARFALRASSWNRGLLGRKSWSSNGRGLVDRAGEEALAEWAEGDEADAELLERRQDRRFWLAPPE
jgi:hypothetical protein